MIKMIIAPHDSPTKFEVDRLIFSDGYVTGMRKGFYSITIPISKCDLDITVEEE